MKYALDTNIVSEFMKPHPCQEVIWWIQDHTDDVYLNAVTIQELYYGINIMPDGKRKQLYKETVDAVLKDCSDRVFPYDSFCAYLCAESRAEARTEGRQVSIEDSMIAAICRRNDAALVTRNVKDFEHLGIEVINPFGYESPTMARLREEERKRKKASSSKQQ